MDPTNFIQAYDMREREAALQYIEVLVPGPYPMNKVQKDWFLGNSYLFTSLKCLDLSYQDIDDEFIEEVCWEDFRSVSEINLSHNPRITSCSLDAIFQSESLGSITFLFSMSGRYDAPQSIINVNVTNTKITTDEQKKYKDLVRFEFKFECKSKRSGSSHFRGIKKLNVTMDHPLHDNCYRPNYCDPCCRCRCHCPCHRYR